MKNPYTKYTPMIKALADEARLKIVHMLAGGPLCACQILKEFDFTQPTLSYHMKVLADSGLVKGVRKGAWMWYSLDRNKLDRLIQFITEITDGAGAKDPDHEECDCR